MWIPRLIFIVIGFILLIISAKAVTFTIFFSEEIISEQIMTEGLLWGFGENDYSINTKIMDVNLAKEYVFRFDRNVFEGFSQAIESGWLFESPEDKTYQINVLSASGNCGFTLFNKHPSDQFRTSLKVGTHNLSLKAGMKSYLVVDPDAYDICLIKLGSINKIAYFYITVSELPEAYQYMGSKFFYDADLNCMRTWEDKIAGDKICYDEWHNLGCTDMEIWKFDRMGCLTRLLKEKELSAEQAKLAEEQAKKESVPEVVKALNELKTQQAVLQNDMNRITTGAIALFAGNLNTIFTGIFVITGLFAFFMVWRRRRISSGLSLRHPNFGRRISHSDSEPVEVLKGEDGYVEKPASAEPRKSKEEWW